MRGAAAIGGALCAALLAVVAGGCGVAAATAARSNAGVIGLARKWLAPPARAAVARSSDA